MKHNCWAIPQHFLFVWGKAREIAFLSISTKVPGETNAAASLGTTL